MTNLVFLNNNNEAVTDSLMVAEVFGKQHKNVIQSIHNLHSELGEKGKLIFQPTSYKDSFNREQLKYDLTKDGFTLLVMGFNGKEALQFKMAYIEEFNRMEEHIKQPQQLKPIDQIKLLMANSLDTEERLSTVESNVEILRNTMTIDYGQQQVLNNIKMQRVEKMWEEFGGIGVYDTKRKMYAKFGKDLKNAFAVSSYRDIAARDFEEAINYAKAWRPSLF
ncbi:Rha family transcriptional regulator [Bacillus sp. TK-2]|uniref:Rha family transcriptional regulator n=1 Tax=Bacillus cereus TaxID=1396 RepID=UPI0019129079|nr:Rha family transcriptional regulator [Bacillus cereus]QQP77681.1 Rha family transcriptional regulator [Bacillus sp. TK-2]MCU5522736.1 Rha family transcriptional regulator [Bacillus cereus]MDA2329845.1 Rha family transcriptional regulator [Bacillus cereus]MDA2335680.1 Rha family transcriptional regulator [Bacillus cereus]HDR8154443.1 Rha family transcriptional regulator [Bacillus cereus]